MVYRVGFMGAKMILGGKSRYAVIAHTLDPDISDISDISDNLRPFTIHLLVLAPTLALYSALCSITLPLL